jgi:hypothetical protein
VPDERTIKVRNEAIAFRSFGLPTWMTSLRKRSQAAIERSFNS